jgi:hypothetical protein
MRDMTQHQGPADKIMIIRHGEKPLGHPGTPVGVTHDGSPARHALTVRGWQRAGALASLFTTPPAAKPVAVPDLLVSRAYPGSKTDHRVHQTLQPLADRLTLEIEQWGTPDDPQSAIAELLSSTGRQVALLCWDHKEIPALAGAIPTGDQLPAAWPDDRFDLIWIFDRVAGDELRYTFSTADQSLLSGDV